MIMRARKTNKKMKMTISVIVVKNCCMNDKKLNATALLDYKRTLSLCKCDTNVNAKFFCEILFPWKMEETANFLEL